MIFYILEDHPMIVEGIQSVVSSVYPEVKFVAESNLENAMSNLNWVNYDLAIVDLNISGKRSFGFLEEATKRHKQSKHLIFTSSIRKDYFEQAFAFPIDGYLVKESMPEDLIYAIGTVLKGRKFIDPIFLDIQQSKEQKIEKLTEREREVLRLIGKGDSNQDIADNMYISVNTVKKYVASIMQKMEFNNRTEAALFCQQNYV